MIIIIMNLIIMINTIIDQKVMNLQLSLQNIITRKVMKMIIFKLILKGKMKIRIN